MGLLMLWRWVHIEDNGSEQVEVLQGCAVSKDNLA